MTLSHLAATLLGVYLFFTLLPVIVAWRRELPAAEQQRVFVYGVLLGWALAGYAWAWFIATDDAAPALRITQRITITADAREMDIIIDVAHDAEGRAK